MDKVKVHRVGNPPSTPHPQATNSEPTPSEIGKALSALGSSKGGLARAKLLTAEERSDIARRAVEARWARAGKLKERTYRATHGSDEHPLRIGDITIPCFVLEDGRRILAQRGLQNGLGMNPSGGAQRMLKLVRAVARSPDEFNNLAERITSPIKFQPPWGGTLAHGYEATILADLCDAILEARKRGLLNYNQQKTAERCEILVRGFARVGIIALIDEATGYQDDRARDALAKILEAFVAKELQPYVKIFPAEYFKELYRLKGLNWPPRGNKMPRYFGRITNDIVYSRLAPGLLRKFNEQNPPDEKGYRKKKNTQWLTDEVGKPKLLEHLAVTTAFMKVCDNGDYDGFHKLLDKAKPKQIEMPLFDSLPGHGEPKLLTDN